MATANDLITQSLRLLNVLNAAEAAQDEDADLGLTVLNQWIDSLGSAHQSKYALLRTVHTLTADTASYTIGSGGTIDIVRPVRLEWAGLVINSGASTVTEIPVHLLTDQEYAEWPQKTLKSSLSSSVWYDHDWSSGLGKVYPLPIPNVSTTQLVLYTSTAIIKFANQSTEYTFPPAYERAILYNLAEELANYYPSSRPPQRLPFLAAESLAEVKRANLRLMKATIDPSLLTKSGATWPQSRFLVGQV
jgi:hypothetical protein